MRVLILAVTPLVLLSGFVGNDSTASSHTAIRKLLADAPVDPTPVLGVTLEAVKVVGASTMVPGSYAESRDGESVECDVIEFRITNHGKDAIWFSVFGATPTIPMLQLEAFSGDRWTGLIPVVGKDGSVENFQEAGWGHIASRDVVVKPNQRWTFTVNLEQWKTQVAKRLRMMLQVSKVGFVSGDREYACEEVISNGFCVALK